MAVDAKALEEHWVHSHEEDTDAHMVFRPASYAFPPSRGRRGFELKPDGSMVRWGPSPTDRRQATAGAWKLQEGNRLALYDDPGGEPRSVLQIESVGKDRLVVKK